MFKITLQDIDNALESRQFSEARLLFDAKYLKYASAHNIDQLSLFLVLVDGIFVYLNNLESQGHINCQKEFFDYAINSISKRHLNNRVQYSANLLSAFLDTFNDDEDSDYDDEDSEDDDSMTDTINQSQQLVDIMRKLQQIKKHLPK